eukprot:scaffold96571_cov49-Attheya_sp.AAC.1
MSSQIRQRQPSQLREQGVSVACPTDSQLQATNQNGQDMPLTPPPSEVTLSPASAVSEIAEDPALENTEHTTGGHTSVPPIIRDVASENSEKGQPLNDSKRQAELRMMGQEGLTDDLPSEIDVDEENQQIPSNDLDTTTSWKDVFQACCCHSKMEWMNISLGILILLFFLYFFLVGLELLSSSFRVVGGCTAESILGSDTNPLSSVMIGVIVTALLQSSSTTTAIIVSLVGGGLDVKSAIYLVSKYQPCIHKKQSIARIYSSNIKALSLGFQVGANIGTAVTGLFVSIAHMGDKDELQRAFSGSSVVWVFKVLTVAILFPLEIVSDYLYLLTKSMLPSDVGEGEKWEGPIKKIVSPFGSLFIIANKDMIDDIASSDGNITCANFYPVTCIGGKETYKTCKAGLIGCDPDTNKCPMYPLTLGADVGTTFTALMAAMVSNSVQSLQVALVHLFFNLTGIAIWYPIPFLRKIPLAGARRLGKATRIWSGFPGAFIGINFFLLPLLLIGISACFEVGKRGVTALGIFLVLGLGLGILYFWFWWTCRSGRGKCMQCLYIRNRRKTAIRNLPDDMDYLKVDIEWTKNEIGRLKDFARLPRDRPEEIVGSIRRSIFSEADKEDQISLYESYRSKGWADVLVAAAQSSVEGSLFNTLHRSQQSPHFDDEP